MSVKGGSRVIYENVKRLCDERNISIWALERACGIANGAIGKWNGSINAPRIDTVKAIADYFGVTVDALLKSSDGK